MSAFPLFARAGCTIETLEMPVRMQGTRAIATVGINGKSVPLTVDSGAFFSVLTDAAADQLGLDVRSLNKMRFAGVTGEMDARRTRVDSLRLFKGEIPGVEFVVGGNEPGAGTMGLLGRNVLSFTDTEYDLAHGMIRFHFPNDDCEKSGMAYWAGSTPVTEVDLMRDDRSLVPGIRAKVVLNERTLVALFDTGAQTIVSERAARRAGVTDADLKPAGTVFGAGRGTARAWTAPFAKFAIGGEVVHDNRLVVAQFSMSDADLLVGIDFFLAHRIYVSKQQSRLFITYNGGPVFALDRAAAPRTPDAGDAAPVDREGLTAEQLARRASASAARRDFDGALADLDRACALEPAQAALFAQRGLVQVALRHPQKAMEDVDRALELDPAQADARFARVSLRMGAKDRDGARADLDALDRSLAPQAQMRLRMSELYLALDRPADAVAQLDRWLPSHPNEIRREVALNNRCWARVLLGTELAQALVDCNAALDVDAKNGSFLDSRGWVYLGLGDDAKAVQDFDRAIESRPTNALAFYGRGLARKRLGDAARSEADFAAARKAQPDVDARVARIGVAAATTRP